MPDACTFRNVVKAIGTRQLHTVFSEWMKDAVESISGVVAVDGKQAQRTKNAKSGRFIRRDCLPHAVPGATVRDTDALRAGAVTSAKIFHGWRGGRNGPICRGSALFSLKQRKTGRNQSRHTISSIAAKE